MFERSTTSDLVTLYAQLSASVVNWLAVVASLEGQEGGEQAGSGAGQAEALESARATATHQRELKGLCAHELARRGVQGPWSDAPPVAGQDGPPGTPPANSVRTTGRF